MTPQEVIKAGLEKVGGIVTGTVLYGGVYSEVRIMIPKAECEIVGDKVKILKIKED